MLDLAEMETTVRLTWASKWFLEALGPEGLSQLLVAHEDKSAQAVCTFAYCEPGKDPILFQGMTTVRLLGF